ncbi:MAG: DoxX family protein [Cyclobacteriaceae bacterium]|nr:DoxX family protein [Cyclobacteriaceae bacterium]
MSPFQKNDIAKLLLRITCGGILLFHGSHKVFNGLQHVKDMVTAVGLPEFIAYGNYVGEYFAPILVIIGFKTRIGALIIAFNMLLTILIGHRDIMFQRNDFGGWMIETNVLYMMTALVIFFAGAGKYSLSKGEGKWD